MSYPPNAQQQMEHWLRVAEYYRGETEAARSYQDEETARIYESGIDKALAQADEWRARIVSGK